MTELRQIFERGQLHPVAAHYFFTSLFGQRYLVWEIETILRELRLRFKLIPSDGNVDCIEATRVVCTTNRFAKDWYVFEKVVIGLNALPVNFRYGQQPTLGQLMAATNAIIGAPEGTPHLRDIEFSEDVRKYAAAVVISDGAYPVPASLSFAEEFVPSGPPNNAAQDDEIYRTMRLRSMMRQMNAFKEVLDDIR